MWTPWEDRTPFPQPPYLDPWRRRPDMPGAILGTRSKSAGIRSLQCEVSKNFTLPLDQNLGGGGATAAPACTTITTIGAWEALGVGGCDIGDKNWAASGDVNLADATQVLFSFIGDVYAMQIIGFDNSTAAASWAIDYTITVLASPNFISDMFAGADNPGGGSLLQKDVTPNSNPAFSLFVVNGVENAASEKHGLNSTSAIRWFTAAPSGAALFLGAHRSMPAGSP